LNFITFDWFHSLQEGHEWSAAANPACFRRRPRGTVVQVFGMTRPGIEPCLPDLVAIFYPLKPQPALTGKLLRKGTFEIGQKLSAQRQGANVRVRRTSVRSLERRVFLIILK